MLNGMALMGRSYTYGQGYGPTLFRIAAKTLEIHTAGTYTYNGGTKLLIETLAAVRHTILLTH
jgi:hypothetical protein